MPKLPVVSAPEVIRALQRADFVVDHQVGSHVILVSARTKRRVAVPHRGGKDLRLGTVRRIIRDAGLTVEEFRRFLR